VCKDASPCSQETKPGAYSPEVPLGLAGQAYTILKLTLMWVLNLVPVLLRDLFAGTFSLSHLLRLSMGLKFWLQKYFEKCCRLRKHLPCFPSAPKREKSYANASNQN